MQDKAILNLCVIFGGLVLHSLYIYFLFETVNQAYFNSTKTRKVCGFNELSITTVSPFHLFSAHVLRSALSQSCLHIF